MLFSIFVVLLIKYMKMKEMIAITRNENGNEVINARDLHVQLESKQKFADWIKNKVVNNPFFDENEDFVLLPNSMKQTGGRGGHNKIDYAITLECAKRVAMAEQTAKEEEVRTYFLSIEKLLKDIAFRNGDKKHQLNCMEQLQHLLPDEFKKANISFIKANTVVNKAVSNAFGFPKMIKKLDINNDMLALRESVLNDYIKLFEVLEDNSDVKNILYKKI